MNHKSKLCREHCPKKSNQERVDCRVKDDACSWYRKTELAFIRGEYKIGEKKIEGKGHFGLIRNTISGWLINMIICYGVVLTSTPVAKPHVLQAYIHFGVFSAILCVIFITWLIWGSERRE